MVWLGWSGGTPITKRTAPHDLDRFSGSLLQMRQVTFFVNTAAWSKALWIRLHGQKNQTNSLISNTFLFWYYIYTIICIYIYTHIYIDMYMIIYIYIIWIFETRFFFFNLKHLNCWDDPNWSKRKAATEVISKQATGDRRWRRQDVSGLVGDFYRKVISWLFRLFRYMVLDSIISQVLNINQ
jgi:hypothetical protein